MKKILVTGGAGFIGSHLVDLLEQNKYNVAIIDNLTTGDLTNVSDTLQFYNVDITSDSLVNVFEEFKPEYVVHTAAQSSVPISQQRAVFDADVNILGTINLLEACRKSKVKKLVYTSSAAVYGDTKILPIDEETDTLPISAYGLSKLTGEKYIQMYGRLYDLSYTILRFSNVFGPRQKLNKQSGVIPIFINKIIGGEDIHIYGDGNYTRDFIYVKDVAHAILQSLGSVRSSVYNISSGVEISINAIVQALEGVMGTKLAPKYLAAKQGDIQNSVLTYSKIQQKLNWNPRTSLYEGLKETAEYYEQLYSIERG